MLQAKTFFKPQPVLVLVVGARHVEGGVLDNARGHWREGSVFRIEIDGADDAPSLDAACMALARIPAMSGCARMRVAVADCWLASGNIPWSAAVSGKARLDAAARARLAQDGFALAARDVIRRDDAPYGVAGLALAYPASLLDALTAAAARAACRLESVLALSAAAWTLAPRVPAPQTLMLAGDGMLVLASGDNGFMQALTVRTASAGLAHDQAHALWQRQCLREPHLAAVAAVQWLDLDAHEAPSASAAMVRNFVALKLGSATGAPVSAALRLAALPQHSPLDAVRGPLSSAQVLPIGLALLLAGAALLHTLDAVRTERALAARLNTVPTVVAAPSRMAHWSAAEKLRVAAVNTAIRELNLPFAAILRALEPPRDLRVAVLSVTTTPATSSGQTSMVKIVAEARTGAEMARYVAFLGERKPFTGAHLSEHEIDETALERPYRFTLEAAWND